MKDHENSMSGLGNGGSNPVRVSIITLDSARMSLADKTNNH